MIRIDARRPLAGLIRLLALRQFAAEPHLEHQPVQQQQLPAREGHHPVPGGVPPRSGQPAGGARLGDAPDLTRLGGYFEIANRFSKRIPHEVQPDQLRSRHGVVEVAVDGLLDVAADLFDRVARGVNAVAPLSGKRRSKRRTATPSLAEVLQDLAGLPSNRLEALRGNRAGQHSIRINLQWRICFRWELDGPGDVEIVDYH